MNDLNFENRTEVKILHAAAEVFLEKGRDGARMQEIAQKAGINKALLHYYFRSKEKLFEAVFRTELQTFFRELFYSIPETDDPEIFIRSFVRNYIQRLSQHPLLLQFVLWEIQHGGTNFLAVADKIMEEFKTDKIPLLERVEALLASGKMRSVNALQFTLSLIGVCVYTFVARPLIESLFPGVNVLSPQFLNEREKEIVDLILNGVLKHE